MCDTIRLKNELLKKTTKSSNAFWKNAVFLHQALRTNTCYYFKSLSNTSEKKHMFFSCLMKKDCVLSKGLAWSHGLFLLVHVFGFACVLFKTNKNASAALRSLMKSNAISQFFHSHIMHASTGLSLKRLLWPPLRLTITDLFFPSLPSHNSC